MAPECLAMGKFLNSFGPKMQETRTKGYRYTPWGVV